MDASAEQLITSNCSVVPCQEFGKKKNVAVGTEEMIRDEG
jgi:hypothetical protein